MIMVARHIIYFQVSDASKVIETEKEIEDVRKVKTTFISDIISNVMEKLPRFDA